MSLLQSEVVGGKDEAINMLLLRSKKNYVPPAAQSTK